MEHQSGFVALCDGHQKLCNRSLHRRGNLSVWLCVHILELMIDEENFPKWWLCSLAHLAHDARLECQLHPAMIEREVRSVCGALVRSHSSRAREFREFRVMDADGIRSNFRSEECARR